MSLCKACDDPLVLRLDDEDENGGPGNEPETVPDDLELGCGCHFHWQCLMDESPAVALSLKCPSCDSHLPSNKDGPSTTNAFLQTTSGAAILAQYTNEGGVQTDLDILPLMTEEAYLQGHPETMPARAIHVMCSEGDVTGIVELLREANEEGTDMGSMLYYQDPLADMRSGLHLAIEKKQEEVAWLLLWLSSTMPSESFPAPARQVAESLGVGRLTVDADGDVRSLRDSQDRTPGQLAAQVQGPWSAFLEAGILSS